MISMSVKPPWACREDADVKAAGRVDWAMLSAGGGAGAAWLKAEHTAEVAEWAVGAAGWHNVWHSAWPAIWRVAPCEEYPGVWRAPWRETGYGKWRQG
ncbi:hypothetical protein DDE01_04310 [Desulfovibrio desulfuricans]|nr:hypothetical protein DDE01_04310 [Desulfovibrio desulfuricans]